MPWDFSNIFFGGDIYDTVLREILGVRPTGDPVKDSVYLVVLPLLTLYLFSSHVSGLMHLGKTKLKWVFMAIIFFFVIDRNWYKPLADYSLFAFIALMIWGALTFITSPKIEKEGATPSGHGNEMAVYNMGVPRSSAGTIAGAIKRNINPLHGQLTDERIIQEIDRAIAEGRGEDAKGFQQLLRDRQAYERSGGLFGFLKNKKSAS